LFVPVVSTQWLFLVRLSPFCSSAPVQKWSAPSCHTAGRGVTCGRVSARTVVIQNNSAAAMVSRTTCHGVATAPGSLKRASNSPTGSATVTSVLQRGVGAGPEILDDRRRGARGGEHVGGEHDADQRFARVVGRGRAGA